ncbi:class II aldolase/adducin family protein [Mycolicibacterium smegmatis]|uniref:class II aldolase/adducin family protein n=1 Tax=Mycolicibacterium smegmatis TaxID=1772 RepID=UPI001E41A353|nr:class II aldolase/adducin family protein [Mycolicibacterium smegmatis]UGU33129.1 class II aldolase/adducin family protein [Mycolicibacterium smegmatis]ULN68007.1 class II aldolase/adducin family protein [Mycolicibacterium smegmatis]
MSQSADEIAVARRAVAETGRRLIRDGLVQGTAGNVSVRVGDLVAISPSSVPYESVTDEDVCLVDLDGGAVTVREGLRPSTETALHTVVYRETNAGAVIHHHGLDSVAVSCTATVLPALHYYTVRLGGAPRVAPYHRFGTAALARAVGDALRGRTAALMQNHGAVAYGTTVEEAFERAHLLEWLCALHIRAHAHGRPRVLSDEELAEVAGSRYEVGQQ